jgi:hypothetical protein
MEWMVHVACKGKMRYACKILVGKMEGKRSLGNLGVDHRIILKLILKV